jgi:hypothetical protein
MDDLYFFNGSGDAGKAAIAMVILMALFYVMARLAEEKKK